MRLERWARTLPLRLRSLFRRTKVEDELDEELEYHVERYVEENLARGMSPEEARVAARRAVGPLEEQKEACREARRTAPIEDLLRDVSFAGRLFVRRPGFTAVAVVTLALGIGANTAIFSVVDSVLLRPLPYRDVERLAWIKEDTPEANGRWDFSFAPANLDDLRANTTAFEDIAYVRPGEDSLAGTGEPERIRAASCSPNFTSVLGVDPILGRTLAPEDAVEGSEAVVIIGQALWERHFGSDPAIVGRSIQLDGRSTTVVGVMPSSVEFPFPVDAWEPDIIPADLKTARGVHFLGVLGRLRPGTSLADARSELDGLAARLERDYPQTNKGRTFQAAPIRERSAKDVRPMLYLLLGAVGFVLLIACANVANLLLARIAGRHGELALRAALGARRSRIVRQFLTESVLLAGAGSVLGVAVAYVAVRVLTALGPEDIDRLHDATLDLRVLAFTLVVTVGTGVVFGLVPALRASAPNLSEAMKESAKSVSADPGRGRASNLLVVFEVALSLVLLVGAGLLVRSFRSVLEVPPGFDPRGLATAEVALSGPKYTDDDHVRAFYSELEERLRALSGVTSVGEITALPLTGGGGTSWVHLEGKPDPTESEPPEVGYRAVGGDYFGAMRIPLLEGRTFTTDDGVGKPSVMLVNDRTAAKFFPGESAVGKHIKLGPHPERADWITIVGVVGSVRANDLESLPSPEVYLPRAQDAWNRMSLVIRSDGPTAPLADAIKREVWALDDAQPVVSLRSMDEVIARSVAKRRFAMALLSAFAILALALSAVGLYSVIAYSVTQRTHEIGIRIALGARTADVLRMVVRRGATLALAGVAVGVVGALSLAQIISGMMFGVSATDPLTFVSIAALLLGVALLASYIPARRAARLDPLSALKEE